MGKKIDGTWTFDVADWKPVTHERYCSILGDCTITADEPNGLRVEVSPVGGRVRVVTFALVKHEPTEENPPTSDVEPYLMLLYAAEGGKTQCFVRTDVDLCLD